MSDVTARAVREAQQSLKTLAVTLETIRDEMARQDEGAGADVMAALEDPLTDIARAFQATLEAHSRNKILAEAIGNLDSAEPDYLAEATSGEGPLLTKETKQAVERYQVQLRELTALEPSARFHATGSDVAYADFWTAITRVAAPGRVVAPTEEALGEYYGDDLILSHTASSMLCPLTREMLVDPVRAPCGHIFSRAAVVEFVGRGGTQNCPVPSCSGVIKRDTYHHQPEMAKRVAAHIEQETKKKEDRVAERKLAEAVQLFQDVRASTDAAIKDSVRIEQHIMETANGTYG